MLFSTERDQTTTTACLTIREEKKAGGKRRRVGGSNNSGYRLTRHDSVDSINSSTPSLPHISLSLSLPPSLTLILSHPNPCNNHPSHTHTDTIIISSNDPQNSPKLQSKIYLQKSLLLLLQSSPFYNSIENGSNQPPNLILHSSSTIIMKRLLLHTTTTTATDYYY